VSKELTLYEKVASTMKVDYRRMHIVVHHWGVGIACVINDWYHYIHKLTSISYISMDSGTFQRVFPIWT
jgi:hypothetical protein